MRSVTNDCNPDRGQGLNNAITDAADFLAHLREMKENTPAELAGAVHRYEKELWPRGHEAVLASHENTNAVHDWKTMMQSPLFTAGLAKEEKEAEGMPSEEGLHIEGPSKEVKEKEKVEIKVQMQEQMKEDEKNVET
jgi:hypothetical protein